MKPCRLGKALTSKSNSREAPYQAMRVGVGVGGLVAHAAEVPNVPFVAARTLGTWMIVDA